MTNNTHRLTTYCVLAKTIIDEKKKLIIASNPAKINPATTLLAIGCSLIFPQNFFIH